MVPLAHHTTIGVVHAKATNTSIQVLHSLPLQSATCRPTIPSSEAAPAGRVAVQILPSFVAGALTKEPRRQEPMLSYVPAHLDVDCVLTSILPNCGQRNGSPGTLALLYLSEP